MRYIVTQIKITLASGQNCYISHAGKELSDINTCNDIEVYRTNIRRTFENMGLQVKSVHLTYEDTKQ